MTNEQVAMEMGLEYLVTYTQVSKKVNGSFQPAGPLVLRSVEPMPQAADAVEEPKANGPE